MNKLASIIFAIFISILLFSCSSPSNHSNQEEAKKIYTQPCGCALTEKQMIQYCPVDAVGDSILICKVGTNSVIGSGRPPMTWTEFIQSEYSGGEGMLVNCKTGDTLFPGLYNRVLSYRNKSLYVNERIPFNVYINKRSEWVNIDIPVWQHIVSSVNSEIRISDKTFILKPPYQDKKVFKRVCDEYEQEEKASQHYMISNLPGRLMVCAVNGDTLSASRLINFEKNFSDYFKDHAETKKILDKNLYLYSTYSDYLSKGGKREYIDLTKYVYLKNGIPGENTP